MAGSLTVLSAHRFGRAKEELQTAELLLKNANFRSSINRSYYSIFHAIRAVNALDGFDSSKHSGVIAHFNQEYVKTGVFEKGASKIIRNASELREQADYASHILHIGDTVFFGTKAAYLNEFPQVWQKGGVAQ